MSRPATVRIQLSALRHNLSRVWEHAPNSRVMAIIKADGYGHGIVRTAEALKDADAFGVACLEEAVNLRRANVIKPIVLLEGPYESSELHRAQALDLDIVVHDITQIEMLEEAIGIAGLNVWMKVDTGMHRLGFDAKDFPQAYSRIKHIECVRKPIRLMTHLATANERDPELTYQQIRCLNELSADLNLEKTIANSAAVLNLEDSHCDWVRPGLMLYGVSPFSDTIGTDHGLRAAMTLESRLIAVKQLKLGDPVGYGASWCCPEDMPVGIVAAGYGDGYPRNAPAGTPMIVNDQRVSLVGRPSMDMLAVDLRNAPGARVGDPVELWGRGLPVEEVARAANTIPYELLCSVQKRLNFVADG